MSDPIERMWKELRQEARRVRRQVNELSSKTQRAETAGGFVASTLTNAPLAIDGGMSDGTEYVDAMWIADGLRPNESTGNGSGVLAVYSAAQDAWLRVGDYTPVLI